MLPLNSDLWDSLTCCCDPKDVPKYLAEYQQGHIPERDQLYEDLLVLACGGEVYSAGYAAVPHLISIAESADLISSAILLIFAGHLIGMASLPTSPQVLPELEAAFPGARSKGLELACLRLPKLSLNCPERGWLAATMLVFSGFDAAYREAWEGLCGDPDDQEASP